MEESQVFESPQYAEASPDGNYIASLTQQNLYIQYATSLAPAFTFPLNAPSPSKVSWENHNITWSACSNYLSLSSTQGVHVYSLSDPALDISVSNGSGSLGKIQAAEIISDQGRDSLIVVWEFGRVNSWDLSSGRATEIGDAKMTGNGNPWAIRNSAANSKALALLMRQNGQDVLKFYLPPMNAPFQTITLPTVDALSISWSTCGQWLGILDSALNPQQVHVYTSMGHAYRRFPAQAVQTPPTTPQREMPEMGLGLRSLTWARTSLIAAESQSLTLLNTTTFAQKGRIDLQKVHTEATSLDNAVVAFQETIDAARQRSYSLLTGRNIPVPTAKTSITDVKSNSDGSLAACRDEGAPNALYICCLGEQRVQAILLQHAAIRAVRWHPHRASLMMITTENGTVHIWDVASSQAPEQIQHNLVNKAGASRLDASWIARSTGGAHHGDAEAGALAVLLATRKSGYQIVWPEGRPGLPADAMLTGSQNVADGGDVSQDSLYDILSGRTPLPELKVQQVEAEVEAEKTEKLDDTFRAKVQAKTAVGIEDDSEIF